MGLVGLLDDVSQHCTMAFKDEGDVIFLIGESAAELGGSEWLKTEHEMVAGKPPALDLELEAAVQEAVLDGIARAIVKSAHDCSEGGIAVTLAECCIAGGIGAELALDDDLAPVASLFGETQSRIVVTVAESDADALVDLCLAHEVPYSILGTVGGGRLTIEDKIDADVEELRLAWEPTLECLVRGEEEFQSEELREG